MAMDDSILAPLDGTGPAEAGLRWAQQAAEVCRAPLRLLTVVNPDKPDDLTVAAAEEYLRSQREAVEEDGLLASTEVVVGEPAECILDRATEAGLTVMTYGTSRWLVGAALDFVLRNMKRPVLVVRAHPNHTGAARPGGAKVLVPLDRSTSSDRVLAEARRLAKTLSASIVLCHIVEPVGMFLNPQDVPPGIASVIEDEMGKARSFLSDVAMAFQREGEAVETVVAMGEPPHEIVRIAERAGAGVIAMATRGAGSLSRIMGSVAYAVLLSGRLPCLLVRPNDTD